MRFALVWRPPSLFYWGGLFLRIRNKYYRLVRWGPR